jgi:hypothetical protein
VDVFTLAVRSARFRAAILAAVIASPVACASPTGPDGNDDSIEIHGQIWGQVLQGRQNPAGDLAPDTYANPVSGAVVSTSLDSATTVTDGNGNFALRTRTRPGSGQAFALRITSASYPTYDRTGCWSGGPAYKIALTWTLSDPIVAVAC